jgi:hypothetical protein
MLGQRLLYVICAFALLIAVGDAVARRERARTQAVAPAAAAGALPPPAAQASADMPPERLLHARVGEIVSVAVRTSEPDTAAIPQLGVSAVTSDDVPGRLEFVPSAPGTYPVLLEDSGAVAGRVIVSSDR